MYELSPIHVLLYLDRLVKHLCGLYILKEKIDNNILLIGVNKTSYILTPIANKIIYGITKSYRWFSDYYEKYTSWTKLNNKQSKLKVRIEKYLNISK